MFHVCTPIINKQTRWTKLETSLGAVSRVKNFPALTGSENVPEADHLAPESWPSNGNIEFRDVSAAYK